MMTMTRLLGAAAAVALVAGAAQAQTPPTLPTETTPSVATPPSGAPATTAPATTSPAAPATTAPPAPATTGAMPAAPSSSGPALVARGDIVETLKANGQFKTLVKALEATNMTGVLKTNSNLTLFAPTDAAFAALPAGELDRLMKNPAELQKLLTYHVVNASVDSSKIKGAKGGVGTVAGSEVMIDGSGDTLKANTATIVQVDVKPTNGVIHVVDKVLMPSTAPSVAAATTGATTDAAATAPATVPTPAPTTSPAAPPPGERVDPPMPSAPAPGVAAPKADMPTPAPQPPR